jgi:hypothetical protein
VTAERGAPGPGRDVEAAEALDQLGDGQRAQADGGQLQRQGNPGQPLAQGDDVVAVAVVQREAGGGGRGALHEQVHRVARRRPEAVLGDRQWQQRVGPFAAHAERLPAGRQHRDAGRGVQDRQRELADGLDEVLAGVQDQQRGAVAQVGEDGVHGLAALEPGEAERGARGVREQPRGLQRGQLDEVHAVRVGVGQLPRGLAHETGLADPADPGDGDEPARAENLDETRDLDPPADEACRLGRQPSGLPSRGHARLVPSYR